MRFDFSKFVYRIERRARRLRGAALAGRALLYASLVAIAANLLLAFLFRGIAATWGFAILIVPFGAAIAAFVVGWLRQPNLPRVLLQMDDTLRTGERISSLYEVRKRGTTGMFQDRLEAKVSGIAADWKRGMALPKRTLGVLSGGVAGMLLACALPLMPLGVGDAALPTSTIESETAVTGQMPPSTGAEAGIVAPDAREEVETPLAVADPLEISPRDPTEELSAGNAQEELSLDSILDDLSSFSRSSAQVDAPPTSDELKELAEEQAEARQALSDKLEELQQQMGQNPRPLTQQESSTLQDMASQTGDPDIEDRTDDLVDEPDPEQIGEKLQDLLDEVNPDSEQPDTSPETNGEDDNGSGQSDSPQSTEISGDEEAGQRFLERTADQMQEQSDAGTDQQDSSQRPSDPTGDESENPDDESGPDVRMPGDQDDLSQTGGEAGLGGPSEEAPAGEVGFVHEEAPSTVGSEGEFTDEFVTKGVPVEISSSTGSGDEHRVIDFERMESILHERGLPDEALDSVRRYFELITRPEGGS
jgi:hypothetical protein